MSNSPFSRRGKNSRRRMNAKISKLENQVQAIQTRQDGGPVGGAAYGGTNVLGAAAAGNNMFGAQVPGSFDRDMGDDMEVL